MAERIGVLGGTFDPVHQGHLALARAARKQLALDRLIFVPAGVPWRKTGRKITPAAQRVEMVRLATRGDPAVEVSTIETDRRGPSFTAETLEALVEAHPGAELFFIVGEDALSDLPYWRHPERIIALALLAVARRPGTGTADRAWRSLPGIEERIAWIEMEPVAISASEIRRRIRAGDPVQGMLPEAVERYIHDNRLYR